MVIRDINNNGNNLKVIADEQGDLYVSTWHSGETYSGHRMARKILRQLAEEFEKYKDCKFENEALNKERHEKH